MINDNADKVMPQADGKVPARRFPEFKNSPPWNGSKLGEICTVLKGSGLSKAEIISSGCYKCIHYGELFTIYNEVIKEVYSKTDKDGFRSNYGDILMPSSDVTPQGLGKASSLLIGDVVLGGDMNIVRLQSPRTSVFMSYQINGLKNDIINLISGTTVKHIYSKDIVKLQIHVPNEFEEQEKIAECLLSADNLIGLKQTELESLKKYKKGLLQQLFPQGNNNLPALRFSEFYNLSKWEIKRIQEISENLDNQRVPITSSQRIKGEIPYYGASGIIDFVDGFIFDDDLLCISEDGANLVMRTAPIAFSVSGKSWINNHAHVLKFKDKSTQIIVENYLNSIKLDDFLTGMAQPKLNKAMLDSIPICLPTSPEEQKKIADCLTSLDNLIDLKQQELDKLSLYKKGLLQQLLVQG